jgi:hypothetical protein
LWAPFRAITLSLPQTAAGRGGANPSAGMSFCEPQTRLTDFSTFTVDHSGTASLATHKHSESRSRHASMVRFVPH